MQGQANRVQGNSFAEFKAATPSKFLPFIFPEATGLDGTKLGNVQEKLNTARADLAKSGNKDPQAALEKLDLSPPVALSAVIAIFVGSLVNIPVYRIARHQEQLVDSMAVFGLWGWTPRFQRVRPDTIIAINVGGCVIPMLLAAWQVSHLLRGESWPLLALGLGLFFLSLGVATMGIRLQRQ